MRDHDGVEQVITCEGRDLMLNPTTIAAWLGILVTAGGAAAGAVEFSFWVFDEWQKGKSHEGFSAPTETLRPVA